MDQIDQLKIFVFQKSVFFSFQTAIGLKEKWLSRIMEINMDDIELVSDVVGAVFPGLKEVFADQYGYINIDLYHGQGVTFDNLLWLSKALGTTDINLEKVGPDALRSDDTWTPEQPCRLICRFPISGFPI